MLQRETLQKIREMETTGLPESKLLAEAVGACQDQLARIGNDMMKLRNEIQQLKAVRARAR